MTKPSSKSQHLLPTSDNIETPRQQWFEDYDANKDDQPLADLTDLASEQEDWEW